MLTTDAYEAKYFQERSTLQKTSTDEAALGHATLKSTQNSLKPTHLDSQTAQIEEKEILIKEKRDILDQIVAVKGKEMAKLITDLEAAEDEKIEKLKERSAVEMQISDLKIKHENLGQEVKERDIIMIKLAREKRDLESYIENRILKTKKEIILLEEEIKSLRTNNPPQSPKETRREPTTDKGMLQLLEFIKCKIKAKEEELECPVCFEIVSPPIFTCSDLHLICSDCRPKVHSITSQNSHMNWFLVEQNMQVSICPECREPYPEKAKRHRYAEKATEELAELLEQKAQVLNT